MREVITLCVAIALGGCQMLKEDTPQAKTKKQGTLDEAQLATSRDAAVHSTKNTEAVALFTGPMPTGVTVSKTGRIFVCFPRWGDRVEFTVAELRGGKAVPYPNL